MRELARRVAVQRMLAERSAVLVERAITAVVNQVPAYVKLTDVQVQEVRAISQWINTRLAEMWVDGSRLNARDLNRFRGIGAARAADGRPLMAVLRAYRVATIALVDAIVSEATPSLTVDDLAALIRVQLTALDDLSEALAAGYQHKAAELATDRHRLVDELVHDLVTGRQTSSGALADRIEQLGVQVPDSFGLLLLASPAGRGGINRSDVAAFAASLCVAHTVGADGATDAAPADLEGGAWLSTSRGGLGVLLLPRHPDEAAVRTNVAAHGWRGCLLPNTSPAALPNDHRLAAAALEYAPAEAFARHAVMDRGDALTVAVLRGEPAIDRETLVAEVLGPVLEDRQRHVLDGLTAYLRYGSATEAASALTLHPQTMRHRIRRFTELTGRQLDDSWDRLALTLAHGSMLTRATNPDSER